MTSFDRYLRHTVTIQRATAGAVDDYGQPSRTYSPLATDVRALIQPKPARTSGGTPEEVTTFSAGTQVTDHTVFLRPRDIDAADRILATAAGVHSGKSFEVLLVKDAAGQDHHLELDVRLVEAA
ncbi:MAG: head-tail adaptor protein [Chloroflexi bacterium]|nr:head-tail adaptor protein [Chloroflexota bacterium]